MRHNIITRSLALALAMVMVLGLGVTGVQAAPAEQKSPSRSSIPSAPTSSAMRPLLRTRMRGSTPIPMWFV